MSLCEALVEYLDCELAVQFQNKHMGVNPQTEVQEVDISVDALEYPFAYLISTVVVNETTAKSNVGQSQWEVWESANGKRFRLTYAPEIDTVFVAKVKPR